jgi:hypothetical protein
MGKGFQRRSVLDGKAPRAGVHRLALLLSLKNRRFEKLLPGLIFSIALTRQIALLDSVRGI